MEKNKIFKKVSNKTSKKVSSKVTAKEVVEKIKATKFKEVENNDGTIFLSKPASYDTCDLCGGKDGLIYVNDEHTDNEEDFYLCANCIRGLAELIDNRK